MILTDSPKVSSSLKNNDKFYNRLLYIFINRENNKVIFVINNQVVLGKEK